MPNCALTASVMKKGSRAPIFESSAVVTSLAVAEAAMVLWGPDLPAAGGALVGGKRCGTSAQLTAASCTLPSARRRCSVEVPPSLRPRDAYTGRDVMHNAATCAAASALGMPTYFRYSAA